MRCDTFRVEWELVFLNLDDLATLVEAAFGAGVVGQQRLAAFRASGRRGALDFLMGSASIPS
jgi:hypothetical protein